MQITAQQIKTRGTAIIDEKIKESHELFLSVRGEPKYVILSIDTYNEYREYELDKAISESKKDIASGKVASGIDNHIRQIANEL